MCKPCTGTSLTAGADVLLLRPGISNSSICTAAETLKLKKMGARSPFLPPGYPDQALCCTLAPWQWQATPEPLVSTFSLTPVPLPALGVTALHSSLAVGPLCEEGTPLQRWSWAHQRVSRVRKVQHLACLSLPWLWVLLIGVAAAAQEQHSQGTSAALALHSWKTAAALAQPTQQLSLGSRAKGPSEETGRGASRPSDMTAGYREEKVHGFLKLPLPPFKFQCLLNLVVPNVQHLSLESLARGEGRWALWATLPGPKGYIKFSNLKIRVMAPRWPAAHQRCGSAPLPARPGGEQISPAPVEGPLLQGDIFSRLYSCSSVRTRERQQSGAHS